jgi:asparagine synthase (glutamine-hydrolysing)
VTLAASKVGPQRIETFTSHFPKHSNIDETYYAMQTVKACGVRTTLVEPDLSCLFEEEHLLSYHQAMPYSSLSLYVHWAILSRIKEHAVPVILSGQGGDELFLGYERYYVSHTLSLFPNLPKMMLSGIQAGAHSNLGLHGMIALIVYFGFPRLRYQILLQRAKNVFQPWLLECASVLDKTLCCHLRDLQERELLEGSLSRLLRYDDRTSGAHGLETRLPFLDYRLIEFSYRLPWKHKIRNGWTKYLLRRYLSQHGLQVIAWRRHKLGFNAPNDAWVRQLIHYHRGTLCDSCFARQILRNGVDPGQLHPRQQWNVYNVLRLAELLDWNIKRASDN